MRGREKRKRKATHLLAVQASVFGLDDDESLTGDVEAGALDLLDIALVLVCVDNLLHLLGGDLSSVAGSAHRCIRRHASPRGAPPHALALSNRHSIPHVLPGSLPLALSLLFVPSTWARWGRKLSDDVR